MAALNGWIVTVGTPGAIGKGWDYASNYFPRKFHYKRDATGCKRDAEKKGATGVTVTPFDPTAVPPKRS